MNWAKPIPSPMKFFLLAGFLTIPFLACASGKEPPIPSAMSASIGGFFGGSYRVALKGSDLHYFSRKHGKMMETVVTPTAKQWEEFRSALDEIGIWTWRKHYDSPALDGTQWSVSIAYKGKQVESTGSNKYPGRGSVSPSGYTPEFQKYLSAVQRLVGGKDFR